MIDDKKTQYEAIIADYRCTPAIRCRQDLALKLKLFFNPLCVPVGLTDEMVATCVFISDIKCDVQKRMTLKAIIALESDDWATFLRFTRPIRVPSEISGINNISQEGFEIGIGKLMLILARIELEIRE
jgi:hypothetical protein